jgi:hypothetical protein
MQPVIPDHLWRERDERIQRLDERDLTGVLMGDPPPRRPHSLGACAAGEQVYAYASSVLCERYLVATYARPELTATMVQ